MLKYCYEYERKGSQPINIATTEPARKTDDCQLPTTKHDKATSYVIAYIWITSQELSDTHSTNAKVVRH